MQRDLQVSTDDFLLLPPLFVTLLFVMSSASIKLGSEQRARRGGGRPLGLYVGCNGAPLRYVCTQYIQAVHDGPHTAVASVRARPPHLSHAVSHHIAKLWFKKILCSRGSCLPHIVVLIFFYSTSIACHVYIRFTVVARRGRLKRRALWLLGTPSSSV